MLLTDGNACCVGGQKWEENHEKVFMLCINSDFYACCYWLWR